VIGGERDPCYSRELFKETYARHPGRAALHL
jgi:hypothetical protein